ERRGGLLFGWSAIDFVEFAERAGFASFGRTRTRVHGHPDVFGMLPSTSLTPDITDPGPGRIRALMTLGSNVVLTSAGGGRPLERALETLDLHFSLDLYVNETNKYADYVLPVTTFYERDDFPMATMGMLLRPAIWATDAVVAPADGVRPEWEILDDIARHAGRGSAAPHGLLRLAARVGLRVRPRLLADVLIRTSRVGDWFGLRPKGLSFAKLTRRHPHGRMLRSDMPTGRLAESLRTTDHRISLAAPPLVAEFERLRAGPDGNPAGFPLRLLSLRERNSHNSWMHNVERMMPSGRRQTVHVHPRDLVSAGLIDGQLAGIVSPYGRVVLPVTASAEMVPGNVAIPHGWGHSAGWKRANAAGGVNINELVSAAPGDIEPVAGMSVLSGVPIRIEPVPAGVT
ncbi:MAG TPA: molybdopterin dinucleotide binding domain-containing protein, partial [Acidimicrobiia bacterium]|nr:molybdopterin dinucleotide binding domain-containing protein [Acidimicrobiia bacterium]